MTKAKKDKHTHTKTKTRQKDEGKDQDQDKYEDSFFIIGLVGWFAGRKRRKQAK
jgi:hypothetical protein